MNSNKTDGLVRMTISLPSDLEQKIVDLRKTDRYCRSSYSGIVRDLILGGMEAYLAQTPPPSAND